MRILDVDGVSFLVSLYSAEIVIWWMVEGLHKFVAVPFIHIHTASFSTASNLRNERSYKLHWTLVVLEKRPCFLSK